MIDAIDAREACVRRERCEMRGCSQQSVESVKKQ